MQLDERSRFIERGEAALRGAAELAGDGRTVLSVYLDLTDGWDAASGFVRSRAARVAGALSDNEEEALEVSLDLLGEKIAEHRAVGRTAPGLAVFVSLDDGRLLSLLLPRAPRPMLAVDDEAMVWQLALQLDEYEPVGVIAVDGSEARVLVLAGGLGDEHPASNPRVRHLSKAGGWSQMRYQRRRDEDIRRAADELADRAVEAFEDAWVERVVLAGREEMRVAVEEQLPQRWRERIVDRIDWDLDDELRQLAEEAASAGREAERDEERRTLGRLRGELRKGGLATSGVDDTGKALEWGAVEVLCIGPTAAPDVREELASAAVSTAAEVEVVPVDGTLLDRHDGVAALLRFPVEY